MSGPLRVTVFGENVHEQTHEEVRRVYPEGMHTTIARALESAGGLDVSTVTLQMPEHGLTEEKLAATDVLVWWGHMAHQQVLDDVAARVVRRVSEGMGFISLHSACHAKPFRMLLGTTCDISWREAGEKERLWVCEPGHPIAAGIEGPWFELEHEEMYGEPFNVPQPLETVFISWFAGGEVCRSGMTWKRGLGKVFYFRPGHETYPTYHNPVIQRVIANAVRWAKPESNYVWSSTMRPVDQAPEPITDQG